jgi:large subunit ribosomal protein L22
MANAKQMGKSEENLVVKSARVDVATTLKRMMPRARGNAYQILKRNSHITIVLGDK